MRLSQNDVDGELMSFVPLIIHHYNGNILESLFIIIIRIIIIIL